MRTLLVSMMILLGRMLPAQDTCLPVYPWPVQFFQDSSSRIAYAEAGKGETILFLHGLGGNLSHWSRSMELLKDRYRCIAIDLPGYGHSDKKIDTTRDILSYYADVVARLIKQRRLRKVHLAGHSMGGQIALIIALRYPKLVKRLILAAPAGLETFTPAEAQAMMAATPPRLYQQQNEAAIRFSYQLNFYALPNEAEQLIQDRLRLRSCKDFIAYTEVVSQCIRGMLNHPVHSELTHVKAPVLLLFGKNDRLIPNPVMHPTLTLAQLIEEAKKRMPQTHSIEISNAGHLLPFEKPAEVSAAIHTFLTNR